MSLQNKNIIAIDGPAASGKGTLAKSIARALGFAHMDTGALYRAATLELLNSGLSIKDEADAVDATQILVKKIKNAHDPNDILGDPSIRADKIGKEASKIAAYPKVREVLKALQREFAASPGIKYKGAVLDGRDIGTVICPDATVKLFITASVEVRANRRLKELQSRGIAATYEAVLKDMRERDTRDAERKTAPMKPADDAVIIDSSDLDAGQMLEKALEITRDRLKI